MLTLVFVISRIAYFLADVRFDYDLRIYTIDQFVDVELLRTQLLETLWYMHFQPPLFNLMIGLVAKISVSAAPYIFQAAWLVLGFLTCPQWTLCLKIPEVRDLKVLSAHEKP